MSDDLSRLASALADRYAVESKIGEGGMASVYRARDLKHDRAVAIKVLRPELAAVIGAERFLAEIRTTANLQHPHILPLHDSGEAAGSVFYVMPFIEGESLRDRLERERQLPLADAVQVVLDVAGAVDYAHRHGVIHRDLKPENILLHDGRALVADFGIALAATSAGSRMTETGMSLGTPSYMSPEQAMGERTLDARTDVYALGCVLYETLVGSPPFVGPTAQSIVAKVLTERPQPPSQVRDTVGESIDDVVLTALAKLPADRHATAAAFAEALRAAARGEGSTRSGARLASSAAMSAVRGPSRSTSRRVFALGAAAGVVLTAAAMWAAGDREAVRVPDERVQLTFEGRSAQPAISADGRFIAYREGGCAGGPEAPCDFALLMQEVGGAKPVVLVEHARALGPLRWTADGSQVVFAAALDAERRGVYAIPRLGGVPRLVTTHAGTFDLHARADSLVQLRGAWAVVMDLARGAVADSVAVPTGEGHAIAWSPDGRRFAIVRRYSSLALVGREGGVTDSLAKPFRSSVHWSVDGRHLMAFVAREGIVDDLVRVTVDGRGRLGRTTDVLMSKESALLRGEFSVARDVNRMVIIRGSATFDIWRFSLDGRGVPERLTRGTTYYGPPSLTPDGRQVYLARGDALGDNVYVVDADGREQALTREPYVAGSNTFVVGPDGRRVIFTHSLSEGFRLSEMRLPSGDVRHATDFMPSTTRDAVPFGARGYVRLEEGSASILVMDSLTASPRALSLGADRLGLYVAGGLSERFVVVSARTPGSSGRQILRVPVDGSPPEVVTEVNGDILTLHLRDDGSIWFSRWVGGDDATSLWEISVGSRRPIRRASVPKTCGGGNVGIAGAANAAACLSLDARGDVWLVDGGRR